MGSISSIRLYIPLVNLTSISSSASQALLTPWHSLLQHQEIVPLKYHYYCVSKLRYVVSSPYRSDDKKTKYSKLSKTTIKLVILIRVMPHIPGAFVDISLVLYYAIQAENIRYQGPDVTYQAFTANGQEPLVMISSNNVPGKMPKLTSNS